MGPRLTSTVLPGRVTRLAGGCLVICLTVALAACAWQRPDQLPLGSTVDGVRASMGPGTGQYPVPGGGWVLEYATGPFGRQTWLFEFDPEGRLRRREQVLTEARFNAITAGMSEDEVLRAIGRPSTVWALARQQQNVWSYRYESPFINACQWFMVGMGYDGRVIDTAYGPDPLCEQRDSPADRLRR
jgi:hypothetical protein